MRLAQNTEMAQDAPDPPKIPSPRVLQRDAYFPFLDLPPEIRNMVYSLLLVALKKPTLQIEASGREAKLVKQRPEVRFFIRTSHTVLGDTTMVYPAILLANRQIHMEARSILFSQPLVFMDTVCLGMFFQHMGSLDGIQIQEVEVLRWHPQTNSQRYGNKIRGHFLHKYACEMLGCLKHLQRLYHPGFDFDGIYSHYDPSKPDVIMSVQTLAKTVAHELDRIFEPRTGPAGGVDARIDVLELSEDNFYDLYWWPGKPDDPEEVEENRRLFRDSLKALLLERYTYTS